MKYERETGVERYYKPGQSAGKEEPEGNGRDDNEERPNEIFDSVRYKEVEHAASN